MALQNKNLAIHQAFSNHFATVVAVAAIFLTLGVQGLFAQSGRANITGVVTDSQGAVVAGATVIATNNATGVATPATTNDSGSYNMIQLIPGVYTITATKEGFSTQQQDSYTLAAEQNAGVNFTLQPGKVTEKVTVQAGAELVHTETAELGQTINEHSIDELPLNGRNPASLVLLTPGTVDLLARVPGQGVQGFTTFPTESAASTNGTRQGGTLYLLDGAYNEDNYQLAAAPFPNPDATQEFTVIGNNFDPRYGFAPGGVVSIVTKSGTNNWHGDAFEFYRNGGFNAEDFFTKLTNQVHRNQFGGSLGGPVIKDKLFVFGNYQGTRQSIFNAGSNGFMWTPAMINNGDFSAYCQTGFTAGLCNDRIANSANAADPFVTDQIWMANVNGYSNASVLQSTALANPGMYYPGNMIPTASFSAPAVALAKAIAGNLTPLNQYGSILGAGYPTLTNYNEETFRGDYNLNERNRISARAFLNYFTQPAFSGGNAVASNRSWINHYQNYAGTWTWTINPHMVNNLTGSYVRMYDTSNSGLKIDGKGICYSQFIAVSDSNTTPCSIEELDINGGYQSTGGFPGNWQNFNGVNRWTWGVSDNLSISKGKHLLVAGVDVLRQYWFVGTDWQSLPRIGFDGGPQGQFTGNGFSDFLLGDESFLSQDGGTSQVVNAWMIAPYVADQIKLTPHLTLSAGLRYEPWIAPNTNGRISAFVPGQQSTRYPNAPVGMVFPGDAGIASAGVPSDYSKFIDPRLGLAWQPKALPNTSIRAAFGMYATPIDYSSWNHASELTPFSPAYGFSAGSTVTDPLGNSSVIPIIPFANPWSVYTPLGGVNPYPPFATAGSSPGPSAQFFPPINIQTAFAKNYTDGRTYTWNLSLEHQFGAHWLARAAYVASESDHQSLQNDSNAAPVCATCLLAGTNPRPDQNFTQVDVYQSIGTANYQSGQFTLEKRFDHGFQFQANYTYSHSIDIAATGTGINGGILDDPSCLRCNRGNSFIDTPQVFVLNFIYETPSLSGWNRATKLALGGWEVGAIYRAQSGVPMEILCGCTASWQDAGTDWASYAPNVTSSHTNKIDLSKRDSSGIHGYLNYADFMVTPQGSSGTVGKNPPGMFAPGANTWDMNLAKNFAISERFKFQFRAELFNAFNRVTFDGPYYDGTVSVTQGPNTFGLINSTNPAYPARVIQLAGKFIF